MNTEHHVPEFVAAADTTPVTASKIKELDDLDRFLIKINKISRIAPFVVFFIAFLIHGVFLDFAMFIATVGLVGSIATFAYSLIKFNQRNNKETCEHYKMLITNNVSVPGLKYSDSYSRRDWYNDPTDPASPFNWNHRNRYYNKHY